MPINRNNYEVYFIDYIDGNLSCTQAKELQAFLEQNPDLAAELHGIESAHLVPVDTPYSKSELLKKDSQLGVESRLDYLCIAKVEGDITELEDKELKHLLETDTRAGTALSDIKRTKLIANTEIVFDKKSAIKRIGLVNITHKTLQTISSGVAAALILVFALNVGINQFDSINEEQLAIDTETRNTGTDEMIEPVAIEESTINIPADVPSVIETPIAIIKDKPQTMIDNETSLISQETQEVDSNIEITKISSITLVQIPQSTIIDDTKPSLSLASLHLPHKAQPVPVGSNQSSGVREIGLFELAQMGFNRLSNATGRTLNLDAKKNEEGRIEKIYFESELFALSVPIRKN